MNKRKLQQSMWPMLLLAMLGWLGGCDAADTRSAEPTVLGVNSYAFKFNDKAPGSLIKFSVGEFDTCLLSFIKTNFKQGYSIRVDKVEEGDMDLSCTINNGGHYAMDFSGTAKTYAAMSVTELTDKASITVSFSLFDVNSKKTVAKDNVVLQLSADHVKTMMAN